MQPHGVWRRARLTERLPQTATARTLLFAVPGWPGHLAGQHVDVRLTADDGYQAIRGYSLAAPTDGDRLELGVEAVPDGEVSPYLADDLPVGADVEVRGPLGGWFVWRPGGSRPVLLVAAGAGIAPLRAMLLACDAADARPPRRLVCSVRSPERLWYRQELRPRAGDDVSLVWTRDAPPGASRSPGRLAAEDLDLPGFGAEAAPRCFVCGPTGFVEHAASLLVDVLGHDPAAVRTERFG